MPNYRYRPNYRRPKKENNWMWIVFLFMFFGSGLTGFIFALLPFIIVGIIFYSFYKSASNRNEKYSSPYESTKVRSYRSNSYRSKYNTVVNRESDIYSKDIEDINRKLAFYFNQNEQLDVINDISLRLKGDSYVSLKSLNVYIKDQYVCPLDDFKRRYPDIYNQIIKWIISFDEEMYIDKQQKTVNKEIKVEKSLKSKEFIDKINELNTEIPDELISNGLYETSALLKQINEIESKFPAESDKLTKLYEYYLPMLIKNLSQYKTLQLAQSSLNFEETKSKLQKNVTLINEAMKTITASLCEDDFINLSADITTLESLLKKDGLAGNNRISAFKGGADNNE